MLADRFAVAEERYDEAYAAKKDREEEVGRLEIQLEEEREKVAERNQRLKELGEQVQLHRHGKLKAEEKLDQVTMDLANRDDEVKKLKDLLAKAEARAIKAEEEAKEAKEQGCEEAQALLMSQLPGACQRIWATCHKTALTLAQVPESSPVWQQDQVEMEVIQSLFAGEESEEEEEEGGEERKKERKKEKRRMRRKGRKRRRRRREGKKKGRMRFPHPPRGQQPRPKRSRRPRSPPCRPALKLKPSSTKDSTRRP